MFLQIARRFQRKCTVSVVSGMILATIGVGLMSVPHASECGLPEGDLQVRVTGTHETWLFTWDAKGTSRKRIQYSWTDYMNRSNMYTSIGDKRSNDLPQNLIGPKWRFDAPFCISHKGHKLVSSLYRNCFPLIGPQKLVIVDLEEAKLLRSIDTRFVLSVEWSPTDEHFVVLSAQDVTGQKWKGPTYWIRKALGHPVSYYTLYLTVYDADGKVTCERTIIEKFEGNSGYIDWR